MKQRLVWLIGKPGSGKTTVGKKLEQSDRSIRYYSFSDLLKVFQPKLNQGGFTQDTRDKVYSFLSKEVKNKTIIVSGNPYTSSSFQEMADITKNFSVIIFQISDRAALERLNKRGRKVFAHDGDNQKERLDNFHKSVLPEIEKISKKRSARSVHVEDKNTEEICLMMKNMLLANSQEEYALSQLEEAERDVVSERVSQGDLETLLTKMD